MAKIGIADLMYWDLKSIFRTGHVRYTSYWDFYSAKNVGDEVTFLKI